MTAPGSSVSSGTTAELGPLINIVMTQATFATVPYYLEANGHFQGTGRVPH